MNRLVAVLGAALFLSLAGNLFMAGYMLGHKVTPRAEAPAPGSEDARRAEWKKRDAELRRTLSDSDRKVFEDMKAQNKDKVDALKKAVGDAHDKVEAAQSADPFDAAQLDAAMRAEAAAKAEFVATMRALRKEISSKLSPEGRAAMEKLRPPREGRRMHERRDGMRGEFMERRRARMNGQGEPAFGGKSNSAFGGGPGGIPAGETPFDGRPGSPDSGPDSGNAPDVPPPHDDCGGCEVPGGAADGAPEDAPEDTPPAP